MCIYTHAGRFIHLFICMHTYTHIYRFYLYAIQIVIVFRDECLGGKLESKGGSAKALKIVVTFGRE